jgi:hypothetical protein
MTIRPKKPGSTPAPGTGRRDRNATLSPARLRKLLERLNSGFYDRPEVREVVAESIAAELDLPKSPGKR